MFLCFFDRLLQYKDKFANKTIPMCAVTKTAVYMLKLFLIFYLTPRPLSQLFQHMEGEEDKRENDIRERDDKMYRMR